MPQILMEELRVYNRDYRAGTPTISDEKYDALLEQVETRLKPEEFDIFRKSLREPGGDVKLRNVAGSLRKCTYGTDQFNKFINSYPANTNFFISAKLDGMGYIATYVNGVLVSVTTTGDGITAEDITHNGRHALPNMIPVYGILEVRGEFVLEKQDAEKLGYKNARNGVVGLMKRKETDFDKITYVKAPAYQIMNDFTMTYDQQYVKLENFGFELPFFKIETVEPGQILDGFEQDLVDLLGQWKTRQYLLDGLVINALPNLPENDLLPKHTIAFKVNADVVRTKVVGMEIIPSKDGKMKGSALLEPVNINGTTVKRATIYNFKYVLDNKIGKGAEVLIIKAGEIIPKVIEVLSPGELEYEMYWELCPICGTKTRVNGVDLECPNEHCESKAFGSLEAFVRRCEIQGASETSLRKWELSSIDDLLAFKPKGKNAEKFYAEAEMKIFSQTYDELIGKFNWAGVGEKTITKYLEEMGFEKFREAALSGQNLDSHPYGCGDKTWFTIVDSAKKNFEEFDLIVNDARYNPTQVEKEVGTSLAGKSFCLTGTISRPRKEVEADIKAAGGEIKSVSKNLDFLVAGAKAGSKLAKAEKLGIKIITEAELMEMM